MKVPDLSDYERTYKSVLPTRDQAKKDVWVSFWRLPKGAGARSLKPL